MRSQVFFALSVVAGAFVQQAAAAPQTVTKFVSAQEQSAASLHWSRERINSAPALVMPVDTGEPLRLPTPRFDEAMSTTPKSEAAGRADPLSASIARSVFWQDWAKLDQEMQTESLLSAEGTSAVYTAYDVNTQSALWTIYPHVWDGKLTFNTAGGGSSCSATVISGNNIVTAAHCVYDSTNNVFYNGWVFTPAFRNGSAPYGTFAATSCSVLTSWVNLSGSYSISTWTRHDVAVCKLGNNAAGQTINGAVGWAGRLWDASSLQLVFNSGYPARTYTDATIATGPAQYLRACTAETFTYTTETLGSGCSWGRGISGGSWMTGYKPFQVSGQVNSVNSGLFIGQQNLYGARFNSSNIVPLCTAQAC